MNETTSARDALITWTEGPYSGFDGKAGGVRLFSVNWRTVAGHPNWNLRSDLPGLTHKIWESDDREDLYRRAEKALTAWLARVSQPAKETALITTAEAAAIWGSTPGKLSDWDRPGKRHETTNEPGGENHG